MRLRLGCSWALAVVLLATIEVVPTAAQDAPDSAAETPDSVEAILTVGADEDSLAATPLVLGSDTLGFLYGSTGLLDAEERARAVLDRLQELRVERVPGESVRADLERSPPLVLAGDEPVLAVTPADARGLGMTLSEAVVAYQEVVRSALELPLVRETPKELLVAVGLVLLVTFLLWLSWRLLGRAEPKVADGITRVVTSRISAIRVQGVEFVSGDDIGRSLRVSVWLLRWVLSLALLVVYFPLAFWFFPDTRAVADRFLEVLLDPLQEAAWAMVLYLPNVLNIVIIVVITWRGLILLRAFSVALARGRIKIRGFYPDWARPTYQLLRVFIVAFAVVLVWPYLPNSDSRAFQGVAAFLGLLVTFGSAGAVSNVVGGVVMVYMRPFAVGDRVRIADTMGDVVERGILVTRVRTPKNVVITIPNSQVLGSHLINYSRVAEDNGVILHTSVTIGYDVPWPRVHEALLAAAREVEGILDEPGPFVLQTALGDFTVSYELNAYTKQPERMGGLYSDLHKQIQVAFAAAEIEITSPTWHAVRDGNQSTIPPVRESEPDPTNPDLGPTGSGDEPAVT